MAGAFARAVLRARSAAARLRPRRLMERSLSSLSRMWVRAAQVPSGSLVWAIAPNDPTGVGGWGTLSRTSTSTWVGCWGDWHSHRHPLVDHRRVDGDLEQADGDQFEQGPAAASAKLLRRPCGLPQ